jgi:hypothetical protein
MKKRDHPCPICNGSGRIEFPYSKTKSDVADKHSVALMLREAGYSIRQIMRFLDYKSPNTVQEILKGERI